MNDTPIRSIHNGGMRQPSESDYKYYAKCSCGWEGWAAQLRHGYSWDWATDGVVRKDFSGRLLKFPMDFCPTCDNPRPHMRIVTCVKDCDNCPFRFECYTLFIILPIRAGI